MHVSIKRRTNTKGIAFVDASVVCLLDTMMLEKDDPVTIEPALCADLVGAHLDRHSC